MERAEISRHEVRIFNLLSESTRWLTNKEIATQLSMSERTVRMHTLRFVRLGMLDQAEVFPAHKYRWSAKSDKRNISYLQRLKQAAEVFA
jgi:predicted DNA-binding transcriptional regulator